MMLNNGLQPVFQCQLTTYGKLTIELLHPSTPVARFHGWSLEFIGQLPMTERGNRGIFIALDHTIK